MVNVLVVEDTPFFYETYIDILNFRGHNAKGAINGKQGLDILALDDTINIIFTDYYMPFINGYDFSKIVKTDQKYIKYFSIPIIGIGDFPFDKREFLVDCKTKTSLKLTDFYDWIEQYCI